jgi:predicted PhzF superfamily epimerase YddE/YHI9
MKLPLYQLDPFTSRLFGGNPAAVVVLDAWLPDRVLAAIVSAPGDTVDFVSRFFAPGAGIPEDPVTGSSHCTLVPYWAARLGKNNLTAMQVSPRGGDLWCELRGDRVVIAGHVVEYFRGEIEIDTLSTSEA